jgi:hypothetical protein
MRNAGDETITAALKKLIGDGIDAATYVILEAGSPGPCTYYVQFAVQDTTLFCEAVSNEYLDPPCQLDDGQLRVLQKLGWGPPETEGQNWFRTFHPTSSSDYDQIVRLAHRALHDVYRIPEDAPITMTTSWEDSEPGYDVQGPGFGARIERVTSFPGIAGFDGVMREIKGQIEMGFFLLHEPESDLTPFAFFAEGPDSV